jgi:hypothetical protein
MEKESVETPPVTAPLAIATINLPSLAGLAACTEDARLAGLDADPGPPEPTSFHALRGRLEAVRNDLPPLYRATVVQPFIATLDSMGESGYVRILTQDPNRERLAGLVLDCAQAILQQGEGFAEQATDAFQEVVSDLYDGFLSAEDRKGVNPPEFEAIPPLVKWGNPGFGPYTWPADATKSLGMKAAVVNLPPAQTRRGLLGWAALGHETAGHDVIHADRGLLDELATALQDGLAPLDAGLADYWSSRIDETSSDVMGILNMGPAAGIGLIGFFRGLNAAFGGSARLRNVGPGGDPHPADIVRGYLAAETVALLKFTGKSKWAKAIADETDKDVTQIVLDGKSIDATKARESARIVAATLVGFKARALEQHALGEIQNWRDSDERKVLRLRRALHTAVALPASQLDGLYAAHAVAAAVIEALSGGDGVATIFGRMVAVLKAMHDENPSWGPLFVSHPGDISRDRFYFPQPAPPNEGNGQSTGPDGDAAHN